MIKKIYKVTIKVTIEEDGYETLYKTFLFTDKEKAKSCVNTLYEKRFDKIEGIFSYYKNPFNGYYDPSCVNEDEIIEDGMVVGFNLDENYTDTSLSVMIEKVTLDLNSSYWNF